VCCTKKAARLAAFFAAHVASSCLKQQPVPVDLRCCSRSGQRRWNGGPRVLLSVESHPGCGSGARFGAQVKHEQTKASTKAILFTGKVCG
jgi:hypothetical protein